MFNFNDEMKIPTNFDDYLSCHENKKRLNKYLAQKLPSYNNSLPLFVVTCNDATLTSVEGLIKDSNIINCESLK